MKVSNIITSDDAAKVYSLPPGLSAFMLENAEGLDWVLKAAGAADQLAAVRCLTIALAQGEGDGCEAYAVLLELRDVLLNQSARAGTSGHPTHSDLDAAVRWFGARFDEFLSAMKLF